MPINEASLITDYSLRIQTCNVCRLQKYLFMCFQIAAYPLCINEVNHSARASRAINTTAHLIVTLLRVHVRMGCQI